MDAADGESAACHTANPLFARFCRAPLTRSVSPAMAVAVMPAGDLEHDVARSASLSMAAQMASAIPPFASDTAAEIG